MKYLDVYFLVSASGLPVSVVNELTKINKNGLNINIFVDTNFIYSLLGLHDNPSNEAATDLKELVESISSNINIQFVVHPRTLVETRDSISYHKEKLSKNSYPPNLAEAATLTDIYGVYRTFFEKIRASGQRISPEDYFMPYENNLTEMLAPKGVKVFEIDGLNKYEQTLDVIEDIDTQLAFEKERFKERAKGEQKISHDVLLWHFVQDLRGVQKTSALQAGHWIVTLDYRFLGFDKFKSKNKGVTIVCMHPSQLIQILRFFVPRSPNLEKTLLGVMKFPISFRDIDYKTEQISLKIVNLLARHEHIEDVQISDLTNIFANETLRLRLSYARTTEKQEIEAIENAFSEIVKKKDEELRKKAQQADELEKTVSQLGERISKTEDELEIQKNNSIKAIQNNIETEQKLGKTADDLLRAQQERDSYKLFLNLIIGLIFFIIGAYGVINLPVSLKWNWFLEHDHRLGLQVSSLILLAGICWSIFDVDSERRKFAFGTVVVGIFISVIQIL